MTVRGGSTLAADLPKQDATTEADGGPGAPAGGWAILPPLKADDLVALVDAINVPGLPAFFVDWTAATLR
ncbi:hypothetical protein [Streptomyces sp. NRRL F-525]|uniref:hypothetical protein n=1 Tax=Streptomyces sp. NRRL F-525 TaxID=1463861 RepID=UPI000525B23D|nr:hypothetical protein [Streptomyces sp. NRRL F-525]